MGTQRKWAKILRDQNCHLYSLYIPPLCRAMRARWIAYLVSGILKIIFGIAVLTAAILAIVHPDTKNGEIGNEKIAIFISAFTNYVIFTASAWCDISVFIATPSSWPRAEPFVNDYPVMTHGGIGNIVPEFYSSPFATRHQAATLVNRVIVTVRRMAKSSTHTHTGCPMVYKLKNYIMDPYPDADFASVTDAAKCTAQMTINSIMHELIFYLQAAGVYTCHITLHLWNSYPFTVYFILAWIRLLLGIVILSLASRYFTGIGKFLSNTNEAYNALSVDVKTQVSVFLYTMMVNGLAGGAFACLGGIYSMFVTWKRNQYWLTLDLLVMTVVGLVLCATFVSNYWLNITHDFFCNYRDFFPNAPLEAGNFMATLCQSMSFRFRLNYQYWLTFIAACVAGVQLIWGICIIVGSEYMLVLVDVCV
eukprot:Blabericola_migrator_1__5586@NODE_2841_length_2295_cov_111_421005_g92_i4_p1_GENE_NODE_2841_length_2295_cov_111_421005_g92_i4NODE_2841_length_2295_cov_111_421005_g92_i4_p1_ORF_typecomplete_len420_score50_25Picorna_P3A/PF06363_11/1_2e04Picorna_P3A/PF06363_11/0_15Picorna_P3A/PF06363_11/7_3e02DoxX/PF07681_12/1_1e02DoxX/PF07681_12/1_1e03_NODE_2841_length_2295_cov_111_421005_g92_i46441903